MLALLFICIMDLLDMLLQSHKVQIQASHFSLHGMNGGGKTMFYLVLN